MQRYIYSVYIYVYIYIYIYICKYTYRNHQQTAHLPPPTARNADKDVLSPPPLGSTISRRLRKLYIYNVT